MINTLCKSIVAVVVILVASTTLQAAQSMKPFILASKTSGEQAQVIAQVKNKLTEAKFDIIGEYSPYETATLLIITNETLKQAATKSEYGGYGAAQRVAITKVAKEIQVSYTNPSYMEAAYRMRAADAMEKVTLRLAEVLGSQQQFGIEEGMTAKQLKKYHYMFGMEYFDEPSELAEYDSYEKAISAVESGLQKGSGGTKQVYRLDIPGKQQTVFGVSLNAFGEENCHSDQFIMSEIDFMPLRSTAHLPYEILVDKGEVFALFARFRIAINFPDLAMMGANSFMNIMCAPSAIEYALTMAAGGKP